MSKQDQRTQDSNSGATSLERIMVWAGGYNWELVEREPPEHRSQITVLGAAVFTAAAIAAANWSTAAYATINQDLSTKIFAAVLAGVAALAAVLILDRGTVFLADVMPKGRSYALAIWVIFRAAITLVVSAVTANSTMPLLFGSDLRVHALHMQEASETSRLNELKSSFEIENKRNISAKAAEEAARAEQQAKVLPLEIRNKFIAATRCWTAYGVQKSALINMGMTDAAARASLEAAASWCIQKQSIAEKEKASHVEKMRALHQHALDQNVIANADLETATAAIASKIERAGAIERDALNPWSAIVFGDLIAANSAAKAKWLLITFALMSFELLPLFMKLLIGKTIMGLRISTNRHIEGMFQTERATVAEHDTDVARALADAMRGAILKTCSDPDVQNCCSREFASKIRAFVPLEVVTALLRDIEMKQADIDKAIRRYPRYAGAIAQVSSQAMRDVVALYTSSDPLPQRSTTSAEGIRDQPRARAA